MSPLVKVENNVWLINDRNVNIVVKSNQIWRWRAPRRFSNYKNTDLRACALSFITNDPTLLDINGMDMISFMNICNDGSQMQNPNFQPTRGKHIIV